MSTPRFAAVSAALVLLGSTFGLGAAARSAAQPAGLPAQEGTFGAALKKAERAIERGLWGDAQAAAMRALERDRKNPAAWAVRARAAEGAGDVDLQIHCLHQELRYLEAQGAKKNDLKGRREVLFGLDPVAEELFGLRSNFGAKFTKVAESYEKDGRPHGAIRVWKEVLALDPESQAAKDAIERIASAPDPSLAGDAKPKDLFEDVTDEWIAEHDADHGEWSDAAEVKRENYITVTDAGYEVLIRTAEAMEQMSAFYKRFFRYGTEEDGGSVSRITVHVFKNRDEYLEKGIGPPVEWSAGHFTGSHVECYIGDGGFEGMVGTLFHEAAHQYVSIATNAVGWLNEGLASFFEGTRILPNGSVVMNEPADHRLFPLATRMEKGWMEHAQDGYDPNDSSSAPEKAPTWSIVLENSYSWGPPWYAPTWGVVFFCYNFQDPVDGRFVYRDVFMEFVDKSGGKTGKTAIKTFEEVVLANPLKAYKGLDGKPIERPEGETFKLPANVGELDDIWKTWILRLRDERSGKLEVSRPYGTWARLAAANGDKVNAREHFEKGLLADPRDYELSIDFAKHLSEAFGETDRAARIVMDALRLEEALPEPDGGRVAQAERLLAQLDPKRRTLTRTRDELAREARGLVARYEEASRHAMVQDVAWRFGSELGLVDLFRNYEDAVVARGSDLSIWELAYNERDLEGWTASDRVFRPDSVRMRAKNGGYDERNFDFKMLTLDRLTAGDFSLEADIQAEAGESAFAGFVFGQKGSTSFHGAVYFPPREGAAGTANSGFLDVMTSYGGGITKAWRHVPIAQEETGDGPRSTAGDWHTLRLDVVGSRVDVWWDGKLATSHDFQLRDVVLGRFGVLTGTGEAAWRNVRFLARDPRDPAGEIERRQRLVRSGFDPDKPVDGSFQGLVPPFPTVDRWVQEPRRSFAEAGPVPQLLVFWSIPQNNLVPIDGWLTDFAARWKNVGLEVISVVSPNDKDAIEAYLKEHPVPGSLAIDSRPFGTAGIGESFTDYSIRRFNLPRVLLIDVDGKVAWEGDPGFSSNDLPAPPYASYVDTPMEDLATRRSLEAVIRWRRKWVSVAQPAMAVGDLETALPYLEEARGFTDSPFSDVRRASALMEALDAATEDPIETIALIKEADAGPTLKVLKGWVETMGKGLSKKAKGALTKASKGKATSHWNRALKAAKKAKKAKGDPETRAAALLAELSELHGPLIRALEEDIRSLGVEAIEPEGLPAAWLAKSIFGW